MYDVIDSNNSLNLRTMEYDKTCRTKTSPGSEGNCSRWLFGTDRLGLILVNQAAGMGTVTSDSPNDGFVYHSNCVEIEYLLSSECDLTYPDGTHVDMIPGDCLCHQPGMPHGMKTIAPKNMDIAVILSCAPVVCDRFEFIPGKDTHACDKWQVKRCGEIPKTDYGCPGVEVREVFENNEKPVCFAEVTVKPGGVFPPEHFTANMNCDEMVLVRSGKGLAIYPDKTYRLYDGISVYNYAGQPYKYVNTGDEDVILLCTWSVSRFEAIERKTVKFAER